MTMRLNPYLSFPDTARQAMNFYQSVFGGELEQSTFADQGNDDPAQKDKIMHSQLTTDSGFVLMASDAMSSTDVAPSGNYSVSLSGDDDAKLRDYWDKLKDGSTIVEPLVTAPWGDTFGMLVDKFGVNWMVNIAGPQSGPQL